MTLDKELEIDIRKMKAGDLEQVQQIDRLSFALPWPKKSFAFELDQNPCSRSWVAEIMMDNGDLNIIGMVVLWLVEDEGHIGTLAVHPDFRRKGVARKLLIHTLKSIQQEGADSVFLEVRRNNLGAQMLYQTSGFLPAGIRTKYYADTGEDALVLRLDNLQTRDLG